MTCTKQIYNLSATWTTVQLADTVKTAFVDAGVMADWHDSFLSGTVENRIMQVVSDNTKAFGTIYYWFQFTTTGIFLQTATGWNVTTHVPTGTQYQDYYSTTTNATTNHLTVISLVAATNFSITRYTSQIDTGASFFYLRNGTTYTTFFAGSSSGNYRNPNSLVDQNKFYFNGHFLRVSEGTSTAWSYISFLSMPPLLRRTMYGSTLAGLTTNSWYVTQKTEFQYTRSTMYDGGNTGQNIAGASGYICIPCGRTTGNTALTENYQPLTTNILMSPFLPALPPDFGLAPYVDNAVPVTGDTFVVTSGSNEWDIIGCAKATYTSSSMLFLVAKVI